MPIAKSYRSAAERAAEWYAVEIENCIVTRRAIRSQWQSVDFFGSDVVGKRLDGSHVYIQVTTGQAPAVSVRKKKLTAYPWHLTDTVLMLQMVELPMVSKRKQYAFNQWRYISGSWKNTGQMGIPKEWFLTLKRENV
jgi:hypothetical protein